jgi:hypothetical protein
MHTRAAACTAAARGGVGPPRFCEIAVERNGGPRVALRATMLRPNNTFTLFLVGLLAFALVACSGSPPSSAARVDEVDAGSRPDATIDAPTVPPDAGGQANRTTLIGAFTARVATFRTSRTKDDQLLVDILFADADEACATSRADRFTKVLHVTVRLPATDTSGSIPVVLDTVMGGHGPAPQATAVLWSIYDVGADLCSLSNEDQGASGTITLTKISADAVEGTVDLGLDRTPGKVQGVFAATLCETPARTTYACPLAL